MIEILIESQRYYLPTVKIKDYSVMINGQTFFDQTVKNDLRTYDSIQKITTDQGGDLHNWVFTRLSPFRKILFS